MSNNELIAAFLNAGKSVTVCQTKNASGARFYNPRNNVLKENRAAASFAKRSAKARKLAEKAAKKAA